MIKVKKIPGWNILINNKYEVGYNKAIEEVKRLLTIEYTKKPNVKNITTDFEEALINAINKIS
jgi:hypothetical protein